MAESSPNRVEELGKQFLRALDPMRVHGLAMIDGAADVLWLARVRWARTARAGRQVADAFTVERDVR
jgi:hypothetical protein